LVAVEDGPPGEASYCDKSSFYAWTSRITLSGLEKTAIKEGWIRAGQKVTGLEVKDRSASGRVAKLKLVTSKGAVPVSGSGFYRGVGRVLGWTVIRSTLFEVAMSTRDTKTVFEFHGKGFGHGVGLCQTGASGMARQHFTYREILTHYYPNTDLSERNGATLALLKTNPAP
jgi:stage II sporulation protein D